MNGDSGKDNVRHTATDQNQKQQEYRCPVCGKVFSSQEKLDDHKTLHEERDSMAKKTPHNTE